MAKSKFNIFVNIGMILIAVTLLSKHLFEVPHFIQGLGLGMGIGFELLGIFIMNYDLSKLKQFKKNIFKKSN